MKIKRQELSENYNITADWLSDFSKDLKKNSYNLDYLKDLFEKRKVFSSIDEKMADIKERIGFDFVMKVSKELENAEEKKADSLGENVKVAKHHQSKHSESDILKMENILKYIKDMIKKEPHIDSSASVIHKCREETGLDDLSVDIKKLIGHIDKLIKKFKSNDVDDQLVYTPTESSISNEVTDNVADYYNHANTSSVG